jgi:hypothetical protein
VPAYMNHCGISCTLVSYSINFNYEDSHKIQKRTLMTLIQQMKLISKWNTPLFSCAAQVWEQY